MSLVPTYALADDGRFHKNPDLAGPGWFLCFDDDDPPELVAEAGTDIPALVRQLAGQGLVVRLDSPGLAGSRLFSGDFRPAESWFVSVLKPIPVSLIREAGPGVYVPTDHCCVESCGEPNVFQDRYKEWQRSRIAPKPPGMTVERLEQLAENGCQVEGCSHTDHEPIVFLHGRCHTGSAVRVNYEQDNRVTISCRVCSNPIGTFRVTAKPPLVERCECSSGYEVSYRQGTGHLRVACRHCRSLAAEIPVAHE